MKELKNQARIEILNYIITFCTVKCFGKSETVNLDSDQKVNEKYLYSLGNEEWSFHGDHFGNQDPPIGSLVMLQAAPFTKYYLGWLKEIDHNNNSFFTKYLIESIEDGDTCWWENVSVWYLPLETSNKHPNWKWTDKQFQFAKKWNNCYKKVKDYQTKPIQPKFTDDGGVILGTREKLDMPPDYKPTKKFDNWKKVTTKEMLEFYNSAIAGKNKKETCI